MITTTWNEIGRQYLAWDPEYLSHISRFGISKANAIARVESAHAYFKTSRSVFKKKIEAKRKSIAVAVAARTFEEIAKEMDAEIKKTKT